MERTHPVAELDAAAASGLQGILCDLDDTLTHRGRLVPAAFEALVAARQAGLRLVVVTGRPAGWVDHLARMWPVDGVVGENGGLWFFMRSGRLERRFLQDADTRMENRLRLDILGGAILDAVPGASLASDQGYRELDLAVDFCEDVPRLDEPAIDTIVRLFEEAGATAKVSSIHVNGWFGTFDKWVGCCRLVEEVFGEHLPSSTDRWAYVGDSANDEPMFERFRTSIGVANVERFLPRMQSWPRYICSREGGHGFAEAAERIIAGRPGPA